MSGPNVNSRCPDCGIIHGGEACESGDLLIELRSARSERDAAIALLADWCVSVDVNGTGWDDWDHHYKEVMYRPGHLRELLDAAIAAERKARGK